ncbi:MAG: hypothetical protein ACRERD_34735, partial [Candidatus Binatia bacterium]
MITKSVVACIVSGALASVLLSGCSAAVATRAKAVAEHPHYSAHWRSELGTASPSVKPLSAKHVALAKSIGSPSPAVIASPPVTMSPPAQQYQQSPASGGTVRAAAAPHPSALFSMRILFPVWSLIAHSAAVCSHSA